MRLTFRDIVKFGLLVGITGIFLDAAIAHGVVWENDPYWTYWVTKTFLIITVFTLGTAFLGVSILRGALITAVFTAVLQAYYSWFAPVGLPQEPMWFIVSDNWKIGYITHFLTIFSAYMFSLWVWRRNTTTTDIIPSSEAKQLAFFLL